MSFRFMAPATLATLLMVPSCGSAQVLMQRDVSLRMALTIAEAALAECGVNTSVAVVDRAGRLRVFLQGDKAAPHNLELARRKAYTARTFQRTSAEWAKLTETTNTGQRMLADVIPLGGGVPITRTTFVYTDAGADRRIYQPPPVFALGSLGLRASLP